MVHDWEAAKHVAEIVAIEVGEEIATQVAVAVLAGRDYLNVLQS